MPLDAQARDPTKSEDRLRGGHESAARRHWALRGYVHNRGDHVWTTDDGGAHWAEAESATFPYARVVPFGGDV